MKKVFVNGAFDVLHSGHLDLLNFAGMLGGHLLVAIDTDEKIRYNKGADRPFNNLKNRKHLMSMLKPVTNVVSFNSDEELSDIIKRYEPDVMVKGSDWRGGDNKTYINTVYTLEHSIAKYALDQGGNINTFL